MGIYRLKRKVFTKYDDSDNLKRMKDSDILAETPKKPELSRTGVAAATGAGALAGGAIGATAGLFKKLPKNVKNPNPPTRWGAIKRGGKAGVIVGGGIALAAAATKRSKQKSENDWYNNRLEYAQRQARRREKADWKANMTQRDGYSY